MLLSQFYRHIGVRVKSALMGLIYSKVLTVDVSASNQSVGKLNNLISVDVNEIQNFCCYSHYMWSLPYEITICSVFLYLVLGKAAFAGIAVTITTLVIGILVGNTLQNHQNAMLEAKDARIAIMNEVLSVSLVRMKYLFVLIVANKYHISFV
jgi:hypothetical protein